MNVFARKERAGSRDMGQKIALASWIQSHYLGLACVRASRVLSLRQTVRQRDRRGRGYSWHRLRRFWLA